MKKLVTLLLALAMLTGMMSLAIAEEPAYDLQGKVVKVRLWDSPNPYDEATDEVKKAEWLPRYEAVKEKYNVTFEFYTSPSEYDEMPAEWIKSVTAGAPAWHITNNLSVMWMPNLVRNNALSDISAPLADFVMPQTFKDVGKFGEGTYGYITNFPGPEPLVFNRKMIMDAGMEYDPGEMFMQGKWSYDDAYAYLTELQSKLPEGDYAFFIDPMYWGLFAPPANGGSMPIRSDYTVGVTDDNFIEALEFLKKLFDAGVIRPVNMTAEGNADYWGTPGATFDKGVEVAMTHRAVWQMGTLNQNGLDWGIVPYPWGSGVTFGTAGDINTIENYHSMYYDAGITGSILAGVEADFPGMQKDYVIAALTNLTYDLFFTEETQADIAAMAAPDYEPDIQMDPFPSMDDAEIYQWMKERIIFNPIASLNSARLGRSYGDTTSLYGLLVKPFNENLPVRSTMEAAAPEIEASLKDAGILK
ncbi:MAG: hypothetical protein ACOX58_12480 [Christensenellales bacterium]|jgi:multiple sugar transport system substrate-binding protein